MVIVFFAINHNGWLYCTLFFLLLIVFLAEKIETWCWSLWPREEEEKKEKDAGPRQSQETQRKRRNSGIAGIVSLIMKADGITSRGEMKAAKNYLRSHYSPTNYKEIREELEVNMRINNPKFVKQACTWLTANMSYAERLGFTEFLFDIARLSKGIDVGEWRLLNDIMKRICLEDEDIEYLSRKYSRDYSRRSNKKAKEESNTNELSAEVLSEPTHDPYLRILGLEGEATPDEIQSAYHKLAKKYHPDTVQDEEMKQILTEKFKEINLAYNALSR
ncbi:MAG: DnaJ domain-containing protein [Paludibacteraceae bacterium]|nr:DnaJ domain-containing protein [Paludibacteraceae bacterium]